MAAGAGGAAWKWRVGGGCRDGGAGRQGASGGGWMEEGGQAERSTRGGLRGPRGLRGEKLEKGRFKYQPPRGGPRSRCLYLASFFFSRTDAPPAHALSFSAPPRAATLLPPFAVLRLCTHTERPAQKDMHTDRHAHAHIYRSSAREKTS